MTTESDFHSLTSIDALTIAWEKVQGNNGCSGADNITVSQFNRDALAQIRQLSGRLRNQTYRPGPLRLHDIPKSAGKIAEDARDATRRLAIPCVVDRIIQTATAQFLSPILELRFHPNSYGYRPGRSVQMAVDRVQALRGMGYKWIVEADIDRAFDNIPHDAVLNRLVALQVCTDIVDLIALWLEHGGQELGRQSRGLAQGSPLSPLLANLFLDAFDQEMDQTGLQIVRFADDSLLLAKQEHSADHALAVASDWLSEHGLRLNRDGSRVVSFERGFAFLGKLFVRGMVFDAPDDQEDPETLDFMQDLRREDEKEAKERKAGHDSGGRILYLTEPGRILKVSNQSFIVKTEADQELVRLAHGRVDRIEVGPAVDLDSATIRHALRTETDLVFVNGHGAPQGSLTRNPSQSAKLHLSQAVLVSSPDLAGDLARRIVDGRIRNQRARLQVLNRSEKASDVIWACKELGRILRKLPSADNVASLRGHEGRAAAVYFPALAALCPDEPAPFKRSRPAQTPLNAAINYLTALLERDCKAAVLAAGLHPGFGVLHSVQDRHEACVWDMMEGFRALATEGLAVALFRKSRLRANMFSEQSAAILIEPEGRRALIKGYEALIARPVVSVHSGNRVGLRRLMIEEARALAHHIRSPKERPFQGQTQDY